MVSLLKAGSSCSKASTFVPERTEGVCVPLPLSPSQLLLGLVGTELLVAMETAFAHSLCLKDKRLRSRGPQPSWADIRDEHPTGLPMHPAGPGSLFS